MGLIDRVLEHPEIKNNPPVLVDVGASGTIHKEWKKLAAHSICIAFDADDREFGYIENEKSGFKKLYVYNCIVSSRSEEKTDFFLTKSPFCSSTLEPHKENLSDWSFSDKFSVVKKVSLNNITLPKVLGELNLNQIDWFKTDSQGIDLKLFSSLDELTQNNIITAEFEPGFFESYRNEDVIHKVLEYMNDKPFWLSNFKVLGVPRISSEGLNSLQKNTIARKFNFFAQKKSPCWAEIIYLNDLKKNTGLRSVLLGWVFAMILKQFGFAYELSLNAAEKFDEPLLKKMAANAKSKIMGNVLKLKFLPAVKKKITG